MNGYHGEDIYGSLKLAHLTVLEARVSRGIAVYNLAKGVPLRRATVNRAEAKFYTIQHIVIYTYLLMEHVRELVKEYPPGSDVKPPTPVQEVIYKERKKAQLMK